MTTISELADEMLDVLHDENPIGFSLFGIPGRDDQLGDLGVAAESARMATARRIAQQVATADPADQQDRITRAVVRQQADALLDRTAARLVEHTLAFPLESPAGALLTRLPLLRPEGEVAEQDYLARLARIPEYLDQAADRHRMGITTGRLPVAHCGRAAVAYLDRYLADVAGDPLREPALTGARVAERDRLLAEVVRPAFARYREVLEVEITPMGRPAERPGLCWLPDGAQTYAALVRMHTTTETTPEKLHQTGLTLIEELAEEYAEIGSRVFGQHSSAEVLARLRTDPALRWRTADELLTTASAAISRAEEVSKNWFRRLPAQRCELRPVPPTEAPNGPTGYYMRPALDGSRPGIFFANTYRVEDRERFTIEALAFHEAVPGHHFQIALGQELTGLPLLRRITRVAAYTEGWALYCERLADEMGLYSDDLARLGMLAEDSTRAARLVVDTGLHAFGWRRQQVVDFLTEHTVMSEVDIQAETDRYIEMPGQALSYMVGRLEINRLRSHAERAIGTAFDIRDFHDVVLGNGILPLSVLSEVVTEWVTSVAG
jgi:uncharacterized protein (DUF885 family)